MLKIICWVILIALLLFFLIGAGVYIYITHPKRISHETGEKQEKERGCWENFDSLPKYERNMTCRDGYLLHGLFVPAEDTKSDKYVIITHGYTYNYAGCVRYAMMFHKLGFHCYIYDLRNFGYNEHCYCSMGYNESHDLIDIYDYFREKYGDEVTIGLHGESLGCASSVMALGERRDIDFLIADCGYSDLRVLVQYLSWKLAHLPAALAKPASWISFALHGFTLDTIRPIEAFDKNTLTPVLFFHGIDDTFIPKMHSERMYEACQAKKKLILVPGADHAECMRVDKEGYYRETEAFLKEISVI